MGGGGIFICYSLFSRTRISHKLGHIWNLFSHKLGHLELTVFQNRSLT